MHSVRLLVLCTLGLGLAGCNSSEGPAQRTASTPAVARLQSVKLALNWFPEAEHGGFYAAQAAGYFEDEGLAVEIVPGGPNVPVIQNVARGETLFGVAVADQILQGRAAGAPVVALMAPLQTSPRCVLLHEETGIRTFEQLENVTLAVRPGITFLKYMQRRLPLSNVKIVPYSGNIAQFLLDKNYAQQAYVFSEPYLAEQRGAKVRTLMVSELGYNPYSSLLFTRDEVLSGQREIVDKMTRASIRGWRKYLDDPEAANKLIHEANPEQTLEALAFGAQALRPLCFPEDADPDVLGRMAYERWQTLADQLLEIGALEPGTADVEHAFMRSEWQPIVDAPAK